MSVLDSWYHIEVGWIIRLQTWDAAVPFFRWFTDAAFGSCLLICVVVFYFVSWRNGFRLLGIYFICTYSNIVLKLAFGTPRPFWVSEQIHAYSGSGSFGLPSGHVFVTSSVWIALALLYRNRCVFAVVAVQVVMVAISRIYLGVHFLIDVLAGIGFAIILARVFTREWFLERFMWNNSARGYVAFMVFLLISGVLALFVWDNTQARSLPESWPGNLTSVESLGAVFQGLSGLLGLRVGALMLLNRRELLQRMDPIASLLALGYSVMCYYLLKELSNGFLYPISGVSGLILRSLRFGVCAWVASYLAIRLFASRSDPVRPSVP